MTFLPPMRPFGPLRISRELLDGHPSYRQLLVDTAATGCCPVWISAEGLRSVRPPDDLEQAVAGIAGHAAFDVLQRQWPGACYRDCRCRDPYGDEFPGLVAAPGPEGCPIDAAVALAGGPRRAHLALVPVTRPADVVTAIGWAGPCNHMLDVGGLSAVLRSWEGRFGALLVGVDRATLWVSVAAPPQTEAECLGVAAEHFAFCCDVDGEDPRPLRWYAAGLRGRRTWRFWWD